MNRLNKQQSHNIFKDDTSLLSKKTLQIKKEMIGKGKLLIFNNKNISDWKIIASSFNEYFVNVRLKLESEIPQSQRSFEMYLKGSESSFEEGTSSDEEIKTAVFSLKGGKRPGLD